MIWATKCPSSGDINVFMRHLVLVNFGVAGMVCRKRFRHSLECWWEHSSLKKAVENRNKHTKKNCAPSWLYLQEYTGIHGQQNIKRDYRFWLLPKISIYK
jgi:hypothetical protein